MTLTLSRHATGVLLQRVGAAFIFTSVVSSPLLPEGVRATIVQSIRRYAHREPARIVSLIPALAVTASPSSTPRVSPSPAPLPSVPQAVPNLAIRPRQTRVGELTIANRFDAFSSPGQAYGPWQTQLLEYQWQAGKRDIPSFTLLNRNDRDRNAFGQPVPSHSTAVYLDDYHNWSKSFFTYVQVMTSNGNILPNRLLYVEADQKFLRARNLVFAVGGSTYANPDGSTTRSLSIGPTLYERSMVYTVRYLPAAVSGSFSGFDNNGLPVSGTMKSYGSGLELVAAYNRPGSNQITATYLAGNQPGILVGTLGALPAQFTNIQRIGELDLTVKHWYRKDFGFIVGATFSSHAMQSTGAKIYNGNAFTAGLFFGHAVGLP